MNYDSTNDTLLHIKRVNQLLTEGASELINRANIHDNYTKFVSDTQRYKMLGNGWTVKIIEQFFCNLNKSANVHQRSMSLFSNCG